MKKRAVVFLSLFAAALVFSGCDTSAPHSPETGDPALNQKIKSGGGVFVLDAKEQESFNLAPTAPLLDCVNESIGPYEWSVCSSNKTITVSGVRYKRVAIKAQITEGGTSPSNPNYLIESRTVRGDGTLLQDESESSTDTPLETNFVALYPASDKLTFNHTSDFSGDNGLTFSFGDTITKKVVF